MNKIDNSKMVKRGIKTSQLQLVIFISILILLNPITKKIILSSLKKDNKDNLIQKILKLKWKDLKLGLTVWGQTINPYYKKIKWLIILLISIIPRYHL